jgi:hypothetical protein
MIQHLNPGVIVSHKLTQDALKRDLPRAEIPATLHSIFIIFNHAKPFDSKFARY